MWCVGHHYLVGRNSSVGRALDWRSKGPWFNPGSGQSTLPVAGKSFWKLPSCYQLIFGWDCVLKKEVLIRHVFTIKVERVPFHVATVAQWIRHRPPKMQSEQQLLRWQPGIAGSSPASGCFHGKACADTFFLRRKTNKGSAACENVLCDWCGVGGVTVSMVAFQAVVPGSTPGRRMIFFLKMSYKPNIYTDMAIKNLFSQLA